MLSKIKTIYSRIIRTILERIRYKDTVRLIKTHLDPLASSEGCNQLLKTLKEEREERFYSIPKTVEECIVRAATALIEEGTGKVITIYSVAAPGHHAECILFANSLLKTPLHTVPNTLTKQGFLTNTGRFVDRTEGFAIATKPHQIITKHGTSDMLFSEDMWGGDQRE